MGEDMTSKDVWEFELEVMQMAPILSHGMNNPDMQAHLVEDLYLSDEE